MPTSPVRLQQVVCAFCTNKAHGQCPGAIRIPDTERVIVCKCCTPKHGMCTTCGHREKGEVDPITWYCLDRYACSARVQARMTASPVHRMLQDVRLDAAAKRRRLRIEAGRIQSGIDPSDPSEADSFEVRGNGKPRKPSRPKSGSCLCCDEATKGGRFLPGHDAKMVSRLLADIDSNESVLSVQAWSRVVELGWEKKPAFQKRAQSRNESTAQGPASDVTSVVS